MPAANPGRAPLLSQKLWTSTGEDNVLVVGVHVLDGAPNCSAISAIDNRFSAFRSDAHVCRRPYGRLDSSDSIRRVDPRVDETVVLPDGRRLAYCEWGEADGEPVLFIAGSPGSRLWIPDPEATDAAGVRLISFDRPGIGASDAKDCRTLADVARDVAALGDALDLRDFSVIGFSTGGIYAAACGALLGDRTTSVSIVATRFLAAYNFEERPDAARELDDSERAIYDLARENPVAAAELCAEQDAGWIEELRESPESIWDGPPEERAPEGDRWFWRDPVRTGPFYDDTREALRQGVEGYKWESLDVFLPWGYRLGEIRVPVTIWWGLQDVRYQGHRREREKWVERQIPDCRIVTWPDAGHMGIVKHWRDVLDGTLQRGRKR